MTAVATPQPRVSAMVVRCRGVFRGICFLCIIGGCDPGVRPARFEHTAARPTAARAARGAAAPYSR